MISFVSGRVVEISGNQVVIEMPGAGIGISITVSASALSEMYLDRDTKLQTEFLVREDGWQLFGFSSEEERSWFRLLHAISGIGPKTAMAAISVLGVAGLATAVAAEDEVALTGVPGLGKKSAGRIVLELKDKVKVAPALSASNDVVAALINLGWSEKVARSTIAELDNTITDTSQLLREALARLAK